MANNIWSNGEADNDGDNPANWGLARLPVGTDLMAFSAAITSADCIFTTTNTLTCAGLLIDDSLGGYDGNIDMGSTSLVFNGASFIAGANSDGSFDCGNGNHIISGGTFDTSAYIGTWIPGTATWILQGDATLTNSSASQLYNFTIEKDAVITNTTNNTVVVVNDCNVNGTWALSGVLSCGSLTVSNGSLNFNGQTGNIANGFVVNTGDITVIVGSIITVSGDISLLGKRGDLIDITSAGGWTLNVSGNHDIRFVNVSNSDASAGSTLTGVNSTTGVSNTNWVLSDFDIEAENFRLNTSRGRGSISTGKTKFQQFNGFSGINIRAVENKYTNKWTNRGTYP